MKRVLKDIFPVDADASAVLPCDGVYQQQTHRMLAPGCPVNPSRFKPSPDTGTHADARAVRSKIRAPN